MLALINVFISLQANDSDVSGNFEPVLNRNSFLILILRQNVKKKEFGAPDNSCVMSQFCKIFYKFHCCQISDFCECSYGKGFRR